MKVKRVFCKGERKNQEVNSKAMVMHRNELFVVFKEEPVDGRARVTTDKERLSCGS